MDTEEPQENFDAELLEVLQTGRANLVWARYGEDPWWPSIAMGDWETLRRFSTVADDEPTGEVEKGKLLIFFLGDSAYELIEKGQVTKSFYHRKPLPKEMAGNEKYRESVEQAQRLLAVLEAAEKPDDDRLRQALENGEAELVFAYTEYTWWPSVCFHSWEAAEKTGAEINLDPRSLKDGYKLVFRLGGLATSWEVVKKVQAYSEKRLQKANNPALEKGYYLGPCSERSQLHEMATSQAESLLEHLTRQPDPAQRTLETEYESTAEDGGSVKSGGHKRGAASEEEEAPSNGNNGNGKKRARKAASAAHGDAKPPSRASAAPQQTALQDVRHSGRERRRKKLSPEEVRKIRGLAEGLMYMHAVQEAPEFMADLSELRESLSQNRRGRIERSTLVRLEQGLLVYAEKMRSQLREGDRAFRKYKAQVDDASTEYQTVCVALNKELGKVVSSLGEQREKLAAQARVWSTRKGFSRAIKDEGQTLGKLVNVMQALEELKPLVKDSRGSKQRMMDSLVDNATVAFKIGEDLTNDQVAAAEQLLRTCADFKARLDNSPHEQFF